MIYLYAGTPGSGKSYHVAKDICFNLWRGVDIIANFDVNRDMIKKYKGNFFYCDNFDMNPFMLKCYAMRNHKRKENGHIIEGQTLLIIDECQIIFNCRSWNDHNRQEWCSFFTQHRKYGYNIILVSQCDRLIDRAIRSLIEYQYLHRKLNNFGLFGMICGLFAFNHPIFGVVEMWYGLKEKIGFDMMIGKKKYYRLYDSYKIFEIPQQTAKKAG